MPKNEFSSRDRKRASSASSKRRCRHQKTPVQKARKAKDKERSKGRFKETAAKTQFPDRDDQDPVRFLFRGKFITKNNPEYGKWLDEEYERQEEEYERQEEEHCQRTMQEECRRQEELDRMVRDRDYHPSRPILFLPLSYYGRQEKKENLLIDMITSNKERQLSLDSDISTLADEQEQLQDELYMVRRGYW